MSGVNFDVIWTEKISPELRMLKPVLNEEEGYYQIGPPSSCNEFFTLAVTVSFATNLPQVYNSSPLLSLTILKRFLTWCFPSQQLIPTSIPLASSGYFFYYSLLGNDVTNETFYDLLSPSFPPERASVKVRSSVEALRAFFVSQPGVQLHLCCGDQSLGTCEVSLTSLLKKGSSEIYMKPVSIEGAFPVCLFVDIQSRCMPDVNLEFCVFQIVPPNRHKEKLSPVSEDMQPVVGLNITLRKEEVYF